VTLFMWPQPMWTSWGLSVSVPTFKHYWA
jgi:hypothetical protein